MKRIVSVLLLLLIGQVLPIKAGTIDSVGTYHGTINGVAYNFFSGTGVGLTGGATCNGQSVVILLNSNPQFKDMLAILLAAQATGGNVRIYRLLDNIQTYYNNPAYSYCVITAISLGDFPLW
jgi:hypothetical protein